MKNLKAYLSVFVVALLFAAACGGSDGDSSSDGGGDSSSDGGGDSSSDGDSGGEDVTLRVLVHQNPPMVEFMEGFNAEFEAANPNIEIDMTVVNALDAEETIEDGSVRLDPSAVGGRIEFHDVDFSYDEGYPVLEGANLVIAPAQTTAFVGSTGSGKTTLIKLLLRFYDVDAGAITLDGVDIRDLEQASLRSSMALVSQDVFLFHGTVAENIAYGRPDATHDEIIAAAGLAEAHDFIVGLPQGYETVVGERGQKLSGGQRQRLSIARALLTDSPVLILDEATSAVDNETEAAIQRSLARVSHNRTMVVIAHRLSTIRHADRIYVVDGGRVAEFGTHEQLLDHAGIYQTLWNVQTGAAVH